jgi:hypothetical protein
VVTATQCGYPKIPYCVVVVFSLRGIFFEQRLEVSHTPLLFLWWSWVMGHPLSQVWMGDCQHWDTIAVLVTKSCSYWNLLSLRKTIQLSELPILQKGTLWRTAIFRQPWWGEAGLRCTEAQLTQVMWIWPSTRSSTRPRGPSTRFIAMWVEGHNSLHHSYRDFFSIYYITITQKRH